MRKSSEYRLVNPATGVEGETARSTTTEELDGLIAAADGAWREWRATSVRRRADLLRAGAGLIRERTAELAEIIVAEIGRPRSVAPGEVELAARIFDYYADNAERLLADEQIPSPHGAARLRLESTGVILGIMPWNYPYYQATRFLVPNLLVGNAVLLKHAPICPESAAAIAEVLRDAGAPDGLYTPLYTSDKSTAQVIADPRVRGVSLTGSERAGRAVAEIAGRNLTKCVLELGGSDPLIVVDRESITTAVDEGIATRMANSGQTCTAPKRMIVLDGIYDDFVEAATRRTQAVRMGDPLSAQTEMGPLSSLAAAEEVEAQIVDAVAQGARIRAGGRRDRAWIEPTLLTDITPGMRAWDEEIFGPVALIHRVSDVDEAIELANSSPYGLSASLFGTDTEALQQLAERLDVGMVFINSTSLTEPELPFGGVKNSGFGRELGTAGLREFANLKLVYEKAS